MNARPSLRIRKRTRTWEAIANAGWRLFEDQGYAETTLEQIAEAADIHKQTVLRYFKTKEDIALASHLRVYQEFEAGLFDPEREISVIDYWRNHVQSSSHRVKEAGGLFRGNRRIIEDNPRLYAHFLAILRRYQGLLERAFAEEAGTDPKSDLHAILIAAALVSGNDSVARRVFRENRVKDMEQACLSVVDYVIENFPRHPPVAKTKAPGRAAAKPVRKTAQRAKAKVAS